METIFALDIALHRAPPAPVYALIGDHDGMQRLAQASILRASRKQSATTAQTLDISHLDAASRSPEAILNDWQAGQLFAAARVQIVHNAHQWKAAEWQTMGEALAQVPPDLVAIFCLDKTDQRLGGQKTLLLRAIAVECRAPFPRAVPQWVKLWGDLHEMAIGNDVVQSLVERCGTDLQVLEQALQKLAIHAHGRQLRVVAPELLDAVVPAQSAGNIFAMTDALGLRQSAQALRVLDGLLAQGEPPVLLLHMLVRHWRMLTKVGLALNAGQHLDTSKLVSLLKVAPTVAPRYLEQAKRFSVQELRRGFRHLSTADRTLKSSRTNASAVLTTCLMHLAQT